MGANSSQSSIWDCLCYINIHCWVFLAICIGVPIGLFTAINLAEIAPVKLRKILKSAIELLAGIPSVVYGLLGILIVNPMMYKLELMIYHGSKNTSIYRWGQSFYQLLSY